MEIISIKAATPMMPFRVTTPAPISSVRNVSTTKKMIKGTKIAGRNDTALARLRDTSSLPNLFPITTAEGSA